MCHGLHQKKTVDRKYFEATSSQHAENVLVAKAFIFLLLKYAFQKAHFFFQISLKKLA